MREKFYCVKLRFHEMDRNGLSGSTAWIYMKKALSKSLELSMIKTLCVTKP